MSNLDGDATMQNELEKLRDEIKAMQRELDEMDNKFGLVLELLHGMVNDLHAPKKNWENKMLPLWKVHIERKRAERPGDIRHEFTG